MCSLSCGQVQSDVENMHERCRKDFARFLERSVCCGRLKDLVQSLLGTMLVRYNKPRQIRMNPYRGRGSSLQTLPVTA